MFLAHQLRGSGVKGIRCQGIRWRLGIRDHSAVRTGSQELHHRIGVPWCAEFAAGSLTGRVPDAREASVAGAPQPGGTDAPSPPHSLALYTVWGNSASFALNF